MFQTHRLVLPSDLNHYGSLFGGRLLAWVDEAAWIAASTEFPHCQFVTIAMDHVEFKRGVTDGAILSIACSRSHLGKTSVSYLVEVRDVKAITPSPIFKTKVTFVSINDRGTKCDI